LPAHDLAEDLRCGRDQRADVRPDEVDLMLVDQLPGGDRGVAADCAEDDHPAGDPLGGGSCFPAEAAAITVAP
jgi:hypothetical protein